jgi:hypothetical protein
MRSNFIPLGDWFILLRTNYILDTPIDYFGILGFWKKVITRVGAHWSLEICEFQRLGLDMFRLIMMFLFLTLILT